MLRDGLDQITLSKCLILQGKTGSMGQAFVRCVTQAKLLIPQRKIPRWVISVILFLYKRILYIIIIYEVNGDSYIK